MQNTQNDNSQLIVTWNRYEQSLMKQYLFDCVFGKYKSDNYCFGDGEEINELHRKLTKRGVIQPYFDSSKTGGGRLVFDIKKAISNILKKPANYINSEQETQFLTKFAMAVLDTKKRHPFIPDNSNLSSEWCDSKDHPNSYYVGKDTTDYVTVGKTKLFSLATQLTRIGLDCETTIHQSNKMRAPANQTEIQNRRKVHLIETNNFLDLDPSSHAAAPHINMKELGVGLKPVPYYENLYRKLFDFALQKQAQDWKNKGISKIPEFVIPLGNAWGTKLNDYIFEALNNILQQSPYGNKIKYGDLISIKVIDDGKSYNKAVQQYPYLIGKMGIVNYKQEEQLFNDPKHEHYMIMAGSHFTFLGNEAMHNGLPNSYQVYGENNKKIQYSEESMESANMKTDFFKFYGQQRGACTGGPNGKHCGFNEKNGAWMMNPDYLKMPENYMIYQNYDNRLIQMVDKQQQKTNIIEQQTNLIQHKQQFLNAQQPQNVILPNFIKQPAPNTGNVPQKGANSEKSKMCPEIGNQDLYVTWNRWGQTLMKKHLLGCLYSKDPNCFGDSNEVNGLYQKLARHGVVSGKTTDVNQMVYEVKIAIQQNLMSNNHQGSIDYSIRDNKETKFLTSFAMAIQDTKFRKAFIPEALFHQQTQDGLQYATDGTNYVTYQKAKLFTLASQLTRIGLNRLTTATDIQNLRGLSNPNEEKQKINLIDTNNFLNIGMLNMKGLIKDMNPKDYYTHLYRTLFDFALLKQKETNGKTPRFLIPLTGCWDTEAEVNTAIRDAVIDLMKGPQYQGKIRVDVLDYNSENINLFSKDGKTWQCGEYLTKNSQRKLTDPSKYEDYAIMSGDHYAFIGNECMLNWNMGLLPAMCSHEAFSMKTDFASIYTNQIHNDVSGAFNQGFSSNGYFIIDPKNLRMPQKYNLYLNYDNDKLIEVDEKKETGLTNNLINISNVGNTTNLINNNYSNVSVKKNFNGLSYGQ